MYLMSAAGHHAVAVHELLERDDHLRALREALRLARDENAWWNSICSGLCCAHRSLR